MFLTYCTNAEQARREEPASRMAVPEALAVGANYGLAAVKGASPAAERLVAFILSPEGQGISCASGFTAAGTR